MKNKFLSIITIVVISSFILSSCAKNTENLNKDEKNEGSIISSNSISQIDNSISQIDYEYTYSPSTIQVDNNKVKNITNIVEKNGTLFGTGYAPNRQGNITYNFFSISMDSSVVYYYPYSTPVESNVLFITANSKNEIFFILSSFDAKSGNQLYTLNMIDADGNVNLTFDINEYFQNPENYICGLELDDINNIYIQTANNVLIFNEDGILFFDIDFKGLYGDSIFSLYDGRVIFPAFNNNNDITLYSIDLNAKKLEELANLVDVDKVCSGYGEGAEIFIFSQNALYSYSLINGKNIFLLNWSDINFDYSQISNLSISSSDKFSFLFFENPNLNITGVTILEKTKVQESSQTIIKLASFAPNRELIGKYNRNSENYRIEVVDYSEFVVGTDYSEAITKLNLDILSGNCPDILDLYAIEYDEYAKSGFLDDLYIYFDNDKTMDTDLLMSGLVEALTIDNKLFAITPEFFITTIVGLSSEIGDEIGISLDELISLNDNLENEYETALFNNMTNLLFVDLYCTINLGNFIDYEKNITYFDSPEFIRLIEFSAQFNNVNTSPFGDGSANGSWMSDEESMSQGTSILALKDLLNVSDLYVMEVGTVGKDLTAIGIPTNLTVGNNIVSPTALYGICNGADNPNGAWDFIKYFLSEEYQQDDYTRSYFPVLEAVYLSEIERLMNPEYDVDNPNLGEFYPAMTQAQANELLEIIKNSNVRKPNSIIMNIIHEEISAFFSGYKSIEETVDIINNRVKVFLNEQS